MWAKAEKELLSDSATRGFSYNAIFNACYLSLVILSGTSSLTFIYLALASIPISLAFSFWIVPVFGAKNYITEYNGEKEYRRGVFYSMLFFFLLGSFVVALMFFAALAGLV